MLRLDSFSKLPWEKKLDGRYWTHITLGEVGKELKYFSRSPNGSIIERVEVATEEGLFNTDSVKSLVGLPIVLVHTPKGYLLNRDGQRVGNILGTIGREDGKLIAEAIVDDFRGVNLIDRLLKEDKTPEASSGYSLIDLKKREDGIYEQIRGEYDHVAAPLMPGLGRGGQNITMRFDDAVSDREALTDQVNRLYFDLGSKKRVKKMIIRMDSKDVILEDVQPETEEVLNWYKTRVDTLTSDLEGVEERLEEIQTEKETLKTRLDSQGAETPDISAEVKVRMDTWADVKAIAPNVQEDYGLSQVDILKKGIKEVSPSLNLDSLDDATIKGIWQGIKISQGGNPRLAQGASASRSQPPRKTDEFLNNNRQDSVNRPSSVAARYQDAYKKNRRG